MRYTKFYTVILLVIMVLNTSKYLFPYIEYNLFNDYIVTNLCVEKDVENNCCQGKCFLEKQINLVNETENNASNPTEKKPINWNGTDDYTFEDLILQKPYLLAKIQPFFIITHIIKMWKKIPCPPPEYLV